MEVSLIGGVAAHSQNESNTVIAGVRLPDFNNIYICNQNKTGTSDEAYKKMFAEQAKRDYANGKFQTESQEFAQLIKRYISEISPNRKAIITEGLQKIAKGGMGGAENNADAKHINILTLLLEGRLEYRNSNNVTVTYAEFFDKNGEMVGKFSNGKWLMYATKAETKRRTEISLFYTKVWRDAKSAAEAEKVPKEAGNDLENISISISGEVIENSSFDRRA